MAIIQELNLFSWKDFQNDAQNLGDLERLKLVIETLPDQKLINILSIFRGNGRNDHPIKAMWNSLIAGIVFQHVSIESLRRELSRNAQLREMCGFDPIFGVKAVPSKSAYNRFLSKLLAYEPLIRGMFDFLVKELITIFPNFGTNLAGDGKAIQSFGKPSEKKDGDKQRRRCLLGKKYRGVDKDGKHGKRLILVWISTSLDR